LSKLLNHLRVGISFDSEAEYADITGPADRFAEFEPESTIEAMEAAVRFLGCTPVRVGGPRTLLTNRPDVDVIWNISEGYGTRNRESWVPVLCEMYGIPCLGSDALTLSKSLDKVLSKQLARQIGIPTANWVVISMNGDLNVDADFTGSSRTVSEDVNFTRPNVATPESVNVDSVSEVGDVSKSSGRNNNRAFYDKLKSMRWPVFLKPRYEGTGKGISPASVVHRPEDILSVAERLQQVYQQDIIVEEHLPGAEFTVAVSGSPLRPHPVLERGIDPASGIGIHVLDAARRYYGENAPDETSFHLSNSLSPELESKLHAWSLDLCKTMQVRDFARLDFKLDASGNPFFLEINPLPTFAIDNTFAILAELEDTPYDAFLARILESAIRQALHIR
jgi:D-alanine-D-alanine ligase